MKRMKSIGVVTAILFMLMLIILFNIKFNNINATKVKIGVIDSYISPPQSYQPPAARWLSTVGSHGSRTCGSE